MRVLFDGATYDKVQFTIGFSEPYEKQQFQDFFKNAGVQSGGGDCGNCAKCGNCARCVDCNKCTCAGIGQPGNIITPRREDAP